MPGETFEASAVSFFKKSIARGSSDTYFLCKVSHSLMYYIEIIVVSVCVTCFIRAFRCRQRRLLQINFLNFKFALNNEFSNEMLQTRDVKIRRQIMLSTLP